MLKFTQCNELQLSSVFMQYILYLFIYLLLFVCGFEISIKRFAMATPTFSSFLQFEQFPKDTHIHLHISVLVFPLRNTCNVLHGFVSSLHVGVSFVGVALWALIARFSSQLRCMHPKMPRNLAFSLTFCVDSCNFLCSSNAIIVPW